MDNCSVLCGVFVWFGLFWYFLGGPLLFVCVTVLVGVRSVRARLARSLWLKIASFLLAMVILTLVFVVSRVDAELQPFLFGRAHAIFAVCGVLAGMLVRMFTPSRGEPKNLSAHSSPTTPPPSSDERDPN